jgi:hypothetical protein
VHRGSFEDVVLARFERRMRSAAHGLGTGAFGEAAIAAAVFEGAAIVPGPRANPETAADGRLCDIAALGRRAVASIGRPPRDNQPLYTTPSAAAARTQAWIAVFECAFHDRAGRLVARDVLALGLNFERAVVMRRDACHALACSLQRSAPLGPVIDARVQARTGAVARDAERTATSLSQRLQQLLGSLERNQTSPIQASLFDKRAEQQARASETAAQGLRRHLQRRLEAVQDLTDVHAVAPRLVALWPRAER